MICIRIENLRKYLREKWKIELNQEKLADISGLKPRLISSFNTNPTHNAELESINRLLNGVWQIIKKKSNMESDSRLKPRIFKDMLNTLIEYVPDDPEFWKRISKTQKLKNIDDIKQQFIKPRPTLEPAELIDSYFIDLK